METMIRSTWLFPRQGRTSCTSATSWRTQRLPTDSTTCQTRSQRRARWHNRLPLASSVISFGTNGRTLAGLKFYHSFSYVCLHQPNTSTTFSNKLSSLYLFPIQYASALMRKIFLGSRHPMMDKRQSRSPILRHSSSRWCARRSCQAY